MLSCVKDSAQPLVARGNAYLAHGQADLALVDYERALRIKPRVPEVMALKGEALAILGRHREALEIFDAALVKRPTDPEILNGRGVVRMALGMVDEANSDWRRQMEALGIDAASARACVALRMADYPAALPALDRALAKEPRDPYWILYRLTALSRLGKPIVPSNLPRDDAWPAPMIALYGGSDTEQQVLGSVDTNNRRAEALFQLGVLALGRGEHGEAIRRWNEVVAHADVDLIEYAAARNELMRLGVKGQT